MSEPAPESSRDRHRFHLLAFICVSLSAASLAFVVWQQGWGAMWNATAISVSTQVVGKWLIFFGAKKVNTYGFGPWGIAYTIFLHDLLIALLLNSFLPQFERIPKVGDWLIRTRIKTGEVYSQYPKLRRMAWTGIMLWVFLPLPGSGAVTGSFASRLVGLSRTSAVLAIGVGSLVACVLFAAMAQFLGAEGEALVNNWQVTTLSALVLIAMLWWGWRRLVKLLRDEV